MRLLEDEPSVSVFPSCEPGRFKPCRLDVVRWWKRLPRGGKPITVPAGLKLAILTRGRLRLPFRSIKWLLELGRKTRNPHMAWARRLPPNHALVTILAGVDVTVELFVVLPALRTSQVNFILGKYLQQRHATEIPNCSTRFLFTWDSVSSKPELESRLSLGCASRLSLDPLFGQANIKMPSAMNPLELRSFVLLAYASFPDEIELHLAPPPPKGGTPAERMWGHLHRVYDDFVVLDEEDDEVLCLIDGILHGADDRYTTRELAEAYAENRENGFRLRLKTVLQNRVKDWSGTNATKFVAVLRKVNRQAQTGLSMIDLLANDDVSHAWPRVKRMWAWRNKALADPESIMHCYGSKA